MLQEEYDPFPPPLPPLAPQPTLCGTSFYNRIKRLTCCNSSNQPDADSFRVQLIN